MKNKTAAITPEIDNSPRQTRGDRMAARLRRMAELQAESDRLTTADIRLESQHLAELVAMSNRLEQSAKALPAGE